MTVFRTSPPSFTYTGKVGLLIHVFARMSVFPRFARATMNHLRNTVFFGQMTVFRTSPPSFTYTGKVGLLIHVFACRLWFYEVCT